MKDYYKLLNQPFSASLDEIQAAYEKLDIQFNPVKNNGDTMFESTYKEIKEAYDVLSNPESKKIYDKSINVNQPTATIIHFKADADSFEDGDTIKLQWATKNVVKVEIDLFGQVDFSGIKIFKPRNSSGDLKLILKAWHSESDTPISQTLTLPFIQELDFGGSPPTIEELNPERPVKPLADVNEVPVVIKPIKKEHKEVREESRKNDFVEENFKEENFFSKSGRIRRSTYLVRVLLLGIPVFLLYYYIYEATYYYVEYNGLLVLSFLALITIGFLSLLQMVKRLHDIGYSGWLALVSLIPYLGGLFGLIIMFIDSNKGTNKYGPDPKNRIRSTATQA